MYILLQNKIFSSYLTSGMMSAVPIQPVLFETEGSSSEDIPRMAGACSEEYIQPDDLETRYVVSK